MSTLSVEDVAPIPLPVDEDGNELAVPCATCGVAVDLSPDLAVERRGIETRSRRVWTQAFARCGACGAIRARAEQVAADRRGLAGRYGSVVTDLIESALVVLTLDEQSIPAEPTRAEVERWITVLTPVGKPCQWIARADEAPGYSHPFPFSYLTDEDMAAVRGGLADLIASRLGAIMPPVSITPPPLDEAGIRPGDHAVTSGCLVCGVGQVTVPITAKNPWTLRPTVNPRQLGGRATPWRMRGYTCPACTAALVRTGSVGPSAMERALVVALGAERSWRPDAMIDGVVAWGGMVGNAIKAGKPIPAPNTVPWEHLGDLDVLRNQIEHGLRS